MYVVCSRKTRRTDDYVVPSYRIRQRVFLPAEKTRVFINNEKITIYIALLLNHRLVHQEDFQIVAEATEDEWTVRKNVGLMNDPNWRLF